jgi:hypothetical protein
LIDDDITIKQNKIVNTVIADGSYDSNKNFQILSFKGIKPAIKRLERIPDVGRPIITLEIRR